MKRRQRTHLAAGCVVLALSLTGCTTGSDVAAPQGTLAAGDLATGQVAGQQAGQQAGPGAGASTPAATTSASTSATGPAGTPPTPSTGPGSTATGTATTAAPTATPTKPAGPRTTLRPGDQGADVRAMQVKLQNLGYWLGAPDGSYGHLTTQAVMALQKASGLGRDAVAGPATLRALANGVRPRATLTGSGVEIDKARQILMIVRGGRVRWILNTSTGGGYAYDFKGQTLVATTPAGTYQVTFAINGLDTGPLGDLWRPRYFNGGIAVHGAGSIPAYPASHGCARVSNAAMDWIWANNFMPIGSTVKVR